MSTTSLTEQQQRRRVSLYLDVLTHAHGPIPTLLRDAWRARVDSQIEDGMSKEEATEDAEWVYGVVMDMGSGVRELVFGLPWHLSPENPHADLSESVKYLHALVMQLTPWEVMRAFRMLRQRTEVTALADGTFELRSAIVSGDDAGEVTERVKHDPRTTPEGLLESLGVAD